MTGTIDGQVHCASLEQDQASSAGTEELSTISREAARALDDDLKASIEGEVRFDTTTRVEPICCSRCSGAISSGTAGRARRFSKPWISA